MPKDYIFSQWKDVKIEKIKKYADRGEAFTQIEYAYRKFKQLKGSGSDKLQSTEKSESLSNVKKELIEIIILLEKSAPKIKEQKDKCVIYSLLAEVYIYKHETVAQPDQNEIKNIIEAIGTIIDNITDKGLGDFCIIIKTFLKLNFFNSKAAVPLLKEINICLSDQEITPNISAILDYLKSLHKLVNNYSSQEAQIKSHIQDVITSLIGNFSTYDKKTDKSEEIHKTIAIIFPDDLEQAGYLILAANRHSMYAIDRLIEIFNKHPDKIKKTISFFIFKQHLSEIKDQYYTSQTLEQLIKSADIKTTASYIAYLLTANALFATNSRALKRWEKLIIQDHNIWKTLNESKVELKKIGVDESKLSAELRTGSGFTVQRSDCINNYDAFQQFLFQEAIVKDSFAATSLVVYCYKNNLISDVQFSNFLKMLENLQPNELYAPNTNQLRYASIAKFFDHLKEATKEFKLNTAMHATAISTIWPDKREILTEFACQLMLEYDMDCILKCLKILEKLGDEKTSFVNDAETKYIELLLKCKFNTIQNFLQTHQEFLNTYGETKTAKQLSSLSDVIKMSTPVKTTATASWVVATTETLINPEKWEELSKTIEEDLKKYPDNKTLPELKKNLTEVNATGWKSLAQKELEKTRITEEAKTKLPEDIIESKQEQISMTH